MKDMSYLKDYPIAILGAGAVGQTVGADCNLAGQKVHIYLEDHAHFAAHCGDLLPDNGARESVVEFCPVDNYYFFPYLSEPLPAHGFYAAMLGVLQPESTRCKCTLRVATRSLRAPPRG